MKIRRAKDCLNVRGTGGVEVRLSHGDDVVLQVEDKVAGAHEGVTQNDVIARGCVNAQFAEGVALFVGLGSAVEIDWVDQSGKRDVDDGAGVIVESEAEVARRGSVGARKGVAVRRDT